MRCKLLPLLSFLTLLVPGVAAAWWQPDWAYRKPVTVDAGPSGASLAGDPGRTPVLVRLHTGNFSFDGVHDAGADIRFVAADDQTVLNHQIELFDPLLGIALIWVDLPSLSPSVPQQLWMYYGNPKAPSTSNGQRTFDPDYTLIYHFGETGAPPRDTTAYGNHAQTDMVGLEGAIIDRGVQLGNVPVMLPASPSLAQQAGAPMTLSMWIRPDQLGADQALYVRRDGADELVVGMDLGMPFLQVNGVRMNSERPVQNAQWTHVAVKATDSRVTLFVGGQQAALIDTALPTLSTSAAIGADLAVTVNGVEVEGDENAGVTAKLSPFSGAMDELRISKVARPDALIHADAVTQGAESRMLALGQDEQQAGKSHFGFVLAAMPADAWVVMLILGIMLVASWSIMIAKGRRFASTARANAAFSQAFREAAGAPLDYLSNQSSVSKDVKGESSLWRLYEVAIEELRRRHQHGYDLNAVSAATIDAIRAAMDGVSVRENERLSKRMSWLSTTIEGAPYVGLFGTVIGIMLVFAVAAMAGAVDINSVAPGMAAALLCTAAGLGVAIPALFGYHWLVSQADAISADMAVFVDEFSTRLAEEQGEGRRVSNANR